MTTPTFQIYHEGGEDDQAVYDVIKLLGDDRHIKIAGDVSDGYEATINYALSNHLETFIIQRSFGGDLFFTYNKDIKDYSCSNMEE